MKLFGLIMFIALSGSSPVFAASPSNLSAWLIGDSGGVWIEERWEQSLGQVDKCTRGNRWTFKASGKLLRETCQAGSVIKQKSTWRPLQEKNHNERIEIDGVVYSIERLVKLENGDSAVPPVTIKTVVIRTLRKRQDEAVTAVELSQMEF